MTISIFGGMGFVGSAFVASRDDCVVEPREGRKPSSAEVVYFISTTDNYGPVEGDFQRDVTANLQVLLEVLQTLVGAPKTTFTYVSTWFVYGDAQTCMAREDGPCHPLGFYGSTKLCAEHLVQSFCRTFGHDYRILRLCNVYGPGDRGASKKKNALTWLLQILASGEEVPLYEAGEVTRDFLHVDDVARAISACMAKAPVNTIINVGSGASWSFYDIMSSVAEWLDIPFRMRDVEPPDFHKAVQVTDFSMAIDRLRQTGFNPQAYLVREMAAICDTYRTGTQ
jgi:nucleoside-diphosphate-sugar epimerase